jgi:hypothetical protein
MYPSNYYLIDIVFFKLSIETMLFQTIKKLTMLFSYQLQEHKKMNLNFCQEEKKNKSCKLYILYGSTNQLDIHMYILPKVFVKHSFHVYNCDFIEKK